MARPPRVIGLAGPAGVGKTTLVRALAQMYGYERGSFAEAIKDVASRFYGVDVKGMEAVREKIQRGEATVEDMAFMAASRQRLWDIGYHLKALDDGCLERAGLYFADMAIEPRNEHDGLQPQERVCRVNGMIYPKVAFDDVRRPGEIEAINARGGVVVWLNGPTAFGDAGRKDTKIDAADCHTVIDVTPAAKIAAGLRSKRRFRDAGLAFGGRAAYILAAALGWEAMPEVQDNGRDDDEDDDEEPAEIAS